MQSGIDNSFSFASSKAPLVHFSFVVCRTSLFARRGTQASRSRGIVFNGQSEVVTAMVMVAIVMVVLMVRMV